MLDKSTIIGFIIGFALVFGSILMEGSLFIFWSFSSILVVGGGILASTMINYSFENIKISFTTMLQLMRVANVDLRTDMELMNLFARRVRTGGLLVLDSDIKNIKDPYLRNGLQLAVDGFKVESLESILTDEIKTSERQVDISVMTLTAMSGYGPA